MSIVFIAATSFMIALSGALVPGPLFTITVSESMKRGVVAGPLVILGHGMLELVLVILLVFQVAPFLSEARTVRIIALVGGAILIVMGIMLLRDAGRGGLEISAEKKGTGLHPVLSGILGSISNPYWTVWWVTIGIGYLLSALKYGFPGIAAFFIGHITADLAWYLVVSFAVSKGKKVIGEKGYRFMMYACGCFLMMFGGWFMAGGTF